MNNSIKIVWRYMKGKRGVYMGAFVALGFAALFSFSVPMVLRFVIDGVIGGKEVNLPGVLYGLFYGVENFAERFSSTMERVLLWCGIVVLLTMGRGVFLYFSGKGASLAAESMAKAMRESLYGHLQYLPYDYHVNAKTGDLIQRCTSDVETVRRFLHLQFIEVGRALFMIGIAVPLLLSIHANLTVIALPVIIILFVLSLLFFSRVQTAFTASDEAEGSLSTVLQENLTGVRVVRAFANQKFELDKFEKKNRNYRDLTYKLIKVIAAFWLVSEFIAMAQIALVLTAGTIYAVRGTLTIGELVVFMSITGMLLWPIRQMGRIIADMGKARVSLGRIEEILNTPGETQLQDGATPRIRGRIVFKDVSFSYDGNREILKNISFTAEPGETIALLGPTGSGKTTILHLLPRLYDYTSGSITIDGIELKDINKKWIRKHVGYVLQEPFLYAKTIKENIALSSPDTTDPAIYQAAHSAAIHSVIERFEEGYETVVGERGVTLSGGQKQRLAIARALIMESPILCFDDSLSAVDTETDVAIRKALGRRKKKATTFIISHRITSLKEADRILVLDGGEIVQRGTHDSLIAREGFYRRIWNIQEGTNEKV